MKGRRIIAGVGLLALGLGLDACGSGDVPSPFARDAGVDAEADATVDARPTEDAAEPGLGAPCLDDAQCDDGVACTLDRCDLALKRCRHTPDDVQCSDNIFCNGIEVCDLTLGCSPGVPVTCTDNNTCTIDYCVEETLSCRHELRDMDGDGDPGGSCGGGDCNDMNPAVSSLLPEICDNGVDDNCNGEIDEADCIRPAQDNCVDALEMDRDGIYPMNTSGAARDYSASCAAEDWVDVVGAIVVTGAEPRDVDLVVRGNTAFSLALVGQCGDLSSELSCTRSAASASTQDVARLWLSNLAPGAYPFYLFAPRGNSFEASLKFLPPTPKPENESCATARAIGIGEHVTARIINVEKDVPSSCVVAAGDLVYQFNLSERSDVKIYAASLDGVGRPSISLRNENCALGADEIVCRTGSAPMVFARDLAPGSYYVSVSATAPTEVDLVVEAEPPSVAPPHDRCETAPSILPWQGRGVGYDALVEDRKFSCLENSADAFYALTIHEPTDVLITQRISNGEVGGVALFHAEADGACAEQLGCMRSSRSPVRSRLRNISPGEYRVGLKTSQATPADMTVFTRPSGPATLVALADTCADAIEIPPEGGLFQGNTSNAAANYDAGCDFGLQAPGGAPDQMLRLKLEEPKRVIFDMQGSAYQTLLNVRQVTDENACPGRELARGCSAGYVEGRSYLDLSLEAGEYLVQVDGYNRASGAWYLDVYISP